MKIHVAIVGRLNKLTSGRTDGSYSCFLSNDKNKAIEKALKYSKQWANNGYPKYDVLVGEVTEKAEEPVSFKLVKI